MNELTIPYVVEYRKDGVAWEIETFDIATAFKQIKPRRDKYERFDSIRLKLATYPEPLSLSHASESHETGEERVITAASGMEFIIYCMNFPIYSTTLDIGIIEVTKKEQL